MPRATFDGNEIDGNFKIEDGVRNTLNANPVARVASKAIANVYDLPNTRAPFAQCNLDEKCRVIAKEAGADSFEIKDTEVWFWRKPVA